MAVESVRRFPHKRRVEFQVGINDLATNGQDSAFGDGELCTLAEQLGRIAKMIVCGSPTRKESVTTVANNQENISAIAQHSLYQSSAGVGGVGAANRHLANPHQISAITHEKASCGMACESINRELGKGPAVP